MGTYCHMDLYLVRHGMTEWNREKRYLGHTDRDVMEEELCRLDSLTIHLRTIPFDAAYTSDLLRCRSTLAYLDIGTIACLETRLREMDFGDWEGKTYEELKDMARYRRWIDDWELEEPPNGESGKDFKERVDSFVDDMLYASIGNGHENVLMMTHGGVIRYVLSKFKAVNSFWEQTVKHGQCMKLSLQKEREEWTCISLSAVPSQEKER